ALGWPPARSGRTVDLAAYALAEPDLVAAYAPDLISHLNAEHADQVRQLAARGTGVARPATGGGGGSGGSGSGGGGSAGASAGGGTDTAQAGGDGDVAGAAVASLDRLGMVIWRVDAEGAQEVRIQFRQPLSEPRALGIELRWLLGHVG
nr:DUF2470 domain-containing protein [Micromonospora sp. DSM 115978]